MNYELAKKLKDENFPHSHTWVDECDKFQDDVGYEGREVPTLSELIEACGEKFLSLEYIIDGGIDSKEKLWWAVSRRSLVPEEYQVAGITAEEAIANLWLELNKK